MEGIEKIYNYIKESPITLIGYSYTNERIKDFFLEKLPCIKINDDFINIRSKIRDILEKKLDKWLSKTVNKRCYKLLLLL